MGSKGEGTLESVLNEFGDLALSFRSIRNGTFVYGAVKPSAQGYRVCYLEMTISPDRFPDVAFIADEPAFLRDYVAQFVIPGVSSYDRLRLKVYDEHHDLLHAFEVMQ